MKVFLLDDHQFFATEIIEYLTEEKGCEVFYAQSYKEAEQIIHTHGPFDFSFLDVLLQNGKTGILFASEYEKYLGNIMFITGCVDKYTLDKLEDYACASKLFLLWDKIDSFLDGGHPKIDPEESLKKVNKFKRK